MSKSYSVCITFLNSGQWGDVIAYFKVSSSSVSALSAPAVSIVRTVTMWMWDLGVASESLIGFMRSAVNVGLLAFT